METFSFGYEQSIGMGRERVELRSKWMKKEIENEMK